MASVLMLCSFNGSEAHADPHSGPGLWISSKSYPLIHAYHVSGSVMCHSPHHRSPVGHWRRVHVPPVPQGGPCAGGCHQSTGPVKNLGSAFIYSSSHSAFPLVGYGGLGQIQCGSLGNSLTQVLLFQLGR